MSAPTEPPHPAAPRRFDRLAVFGHLWAVAGLCEGARWIWSDAPGSGLLFLVSWALLLRPGSLVLLSGLAFVQVLFLAFGANEPWNHGLIMAMLNAGFLLALGHTLWARRDFIRTPAEREAFVGAFAPVFRIALVVFYLFTFFHKVNADFLDPEVSCAGVLLGWLRGAYPFVPEARWMVVLSIWTTLVVELAIPLLLCFRRTVYAGLLLGFGFHLFLSQDGMFYGFSTFLYAVYFLFLPPAVADGLGVRLAELEDRWLPAALRPWLYPVGAIAAVAAGIAGYQGLGWGLAYSGRMVWNGWVLLVAFMAAPVLWQHRFSPARIELRPAWAVLWVIPLAVFANGLSPYLGLKTETSWAMYSNLRTEIRGNHLVIPESWKVFGFQDDLVEILASTDPDHAEYVGTDVRMTFFEFRRSLRSAEGHVEVSFRRGEPVESVVVRDGASRRPELTAAPPWWQRWFLEFRPVDAGARANCRH